MSFSRRLTVAAATAVAIAVVLASALVYLLTSNQLHKQIDTQLHNRGRGFEALAAVVAAGPKALERTGPNGTVALPGGLVLGPFTNAMLRTLRSATPALEIRESDLFHRLTPSPGLARGYNQIVDASGHMIVGSAELTLPVDAATIRLAAHGGQPILRDVRVNGIHLRLLTLAFGKGRAVQLSQPLTDVDHLLGRLRLILALLIVGGIALAALLGRVVAGAAMAPLRQLTATTEHVARTRDLSRRVDEVGDDEIGRLAASFNSMLDALGGSMEALDASVQSQRQLVADASHELRTPVTSLRTNVEFLQQRGDDMEPADQQRLLADVVDQIDVLTGLMNDLIELARGDEPRLEAEELRLDALVADVAHRAGRLDPTASIELSLEPTIVEGVPARLERAVANLIDNAIKYGPPGSPVEVALQGGELSVRDHGEGISDADLPHVFDRFYRGGDARSHPGSGLGLAIVRQVADQHGATIVAERAPGGGTVMRMRMALAEQPEDAAPVQAAPPSPLARA